MCSEGWSVNDCFRHAAKPIDCEGEKKKFCEHFAIVYSLKEVL